jgi:hypothetical protein
VPAGIAEPDARAEGRGLVPGLEADGRAPGVAVALARSGRGDGGRVADADADGREADAVGCGAVRPPGAGLNVATESIAPATRQMARMLASSGMIVPFLASGPASRFSLRRRRWARSSRR